MKKSPAEAGLESDRRIAIRQHFATASIHINPTHPQNVLFHWPPRCQMQKFAARQFHDAPGVVASCARRHSILNDEAGMPADSTIAAHCNDRDFGTSGWQLSINATRNCCGAGGGSWPFASYIAMQYYVGYLGESGLVTDLVEPRPESC